jgi:trehalose 6-phosphate phosphatase
MIPSADELLLRDDAGLSLDRAARLRLFLDYDGTLADLAPTPEHVEPDQDLVGLLYRLSQEPHIRIAVISGRRLSHVQELVPVPSILLAGTYGLELQTPGGERIDRLEYNTIRPALAAVKPRWAGLLAGREGFFLEDKGWSLALHARFAEPQEAEEVLAAARRDAAAVMNADTAHLFRLLGGHKFLEIGPRLAHKGRTVEYLLDRWPWPGAQLLYLGDDDKDEEAYQVIHAHGGIAIVVTTEPRETQADFRLKSPAHTRRWLKGLLLHLR